MLQLLQRGDRSAQEPATSMGHIYSFHACSENISFGSLDEITLVVCCCFGMMSKDTELFDCLRSFGKLILMVVIFR